MLWLVPVSPSDVAHLVRIAIQSLVRRPVRSALTMLGLTIGVGTLIAMMAFGEGAKRAVIAQFSNLGTNIVRVLPITEDVVGARAARRNLGPRDVDALRRDVIGATRVVPGVRGRCTAVATSGLAYATWLYGTTPDYFPLHHRAVRLGGAFDRNDVFARSKVCVLGATTALALFGGGNPVGRELTIDERLTCTVVGVLAEKGLSTSGRDLDDTLLLPLSTYDAYFGIPNGYSEIEVEARSESALEATRTDAIAAMDKSHSIAEGEPRDFRVASPMDAVEAAREASSILAHLLAAIAIVSLVVGGIGIMNIQLVSVAERTAEIGIRSAIGASPSQIQGQFIVESVVLSAAGVGAGVALGVALAVGGAHALHWPDAVSFTEVAIAITFGMSIGVAFGYLPAKRAAELDPIEALRRE